jgi:hypothetical protein
MHGLCRRESLRARGYRAEVEALAVLQLLPFAPEVGGDTAFVTCGLSKCCDTARGHEKQKHGQRSAGHHFFLLGGFGLSIAVGGFAVFAALVLTFALDFLLGRSSPACCAFFAFRDVARTGLAVSADLGGFGISATAAILRIFSVDRVAFSFV